ncbi:MAG TPA: DoxX family protein [Caulobacteraceae bacterium]|jgi:uncharacterized membrane protein YphA (DoxX/SURF4 family)
MSVRSSEDPRWVDAILDWRWTWLIARIGLVGAYLLGAIVKLSNFPAAVAEQEHFGLHPGWLWAALTIAVELVGPALIIAGRWVWLGAGMLGVFTALAALVANNFWALQGQARFAATNAFFEHVGLIAGFVMAALIAEHAARVRRTGVSASARTYQGAG